MASDGLEFVAELKDQMTGPAKQIKAALGDVKKSIEETDKATAKGAQFFSDLGAALFPEIVAAQLVADAIKKVGEVALEAVRGVGEFALKLGEMSIEAAQFREHMQASYEIYRGTAAEGKETYEAVQNLAANLPIPAEKAHEYAKDLLAAGIKDKTRLTNTIASISDLSRVQGDAAAGRLKGLIEESIKTPFKRMTLNAATLRDLNAGQLPEFYAELSKKTGRSQAQLKQMLRYGFTIDARAGIDALNKAIAGGAVGKKAKEQVLDFDVTLGRLKKNLTNLFSGVLETTGFTEFRAAFLAFAQTFDTIGAAGKTMQETINKVMSAIFHTVSRIIIWSIKRFLDLEVAFVKIRIGIAILGIAWAAFRERYALPALLVVAGISSAFESMGQAVISTFAPFASLADMLLTVDAQLLAMWDRITAWWSSLDAASLGRSIVDGIAHGIGATTDIVVEAVKDLGELAIKGVRAVLGIHSPSAVMAQLGDYSAQGFAQGVRAGSPQAQSALQLAVRAPNINPAQSGGNRTVTVDVGGIHINGASQPTEMLAILESQIADVFERVALEMGA